MHIVLARPVPRRRGAADNDSPVLNPVQPGVHRRHATSPMGRSARAIAVPSRTRASPPGRRRLTERHERAPHRRRPHPSLTPLVPRLALAFRERQISQGRAQGAARAACSRIRPRGRRRRASQVRAAGPACQARQVVTPVRDVAAGSPPAPSRQRGRAPPRREQSISRHRPMNRPRSTIIPSLYTYHHSPADCRWRPPAAGNRAPGQ